MVTAVQSPLALFQGGGARTGLAGIVIGLAVGAAFADRESSRPGLRCESRRAYYQSERKNEQRPALRHLGRNDQDPLPSRSCGRESIRGSFPLGEREIENGILAAPPRESWAKEHLRRAHHAVRAAVWWARLRFCPPFDLQSVSTAPRRLERLRRVDIQKCGVALDRDFGHRLTVLGDQMAGADIAIECL